MIFCVSLHYTFTLTASITIKTNEYLLIYKQTYIGNFSNGIGRTGTFLMIYTGMQEIDHGNGIINVQAVGKKMLQQRRYVIREKSQLKFCYGAILYHAQDILAKREFEILENMFQPFVKG